MMLSKEFFVAIAGYLASAIALTGFVVGLIWICGAISFAISFGWHYGSLVAPH